MREVLGDREYGYVTFGLEFDLSTYEYIFTKAILARYCPNCGAELIGGMISAQERYSNSELREKGYDNEEIAKRREVLSKCREISKKTRESVINCPACPICSQPFPEKLIKGYAWFTADFKQLPNKKSMFFYDDTEYDSIFKKMELALKGNRFRKGK